MRARQALSPRAVLLAAAAALASGCIERALAIESEPPFAEVFLNGVRMDPTPVRVPFRHYGVYEVELRKEGFETLVRREAVSAPFYARFPLCLLTEFLWPGLIRDERRFAYRLEPLREVDRADLLRAAAEPDAPARR